jgi:hypothetical protein
MLTILESACWQTVGSPAAARNHSHVGLLDLCDVLAIVRIEIDASQNWHWSMTRAFWPRFDERAHYFYVAQKRLLRASVRGLTLCNACSNKRIGASFSHVLRGTDLYSPSRDGWPTEN